MSALQRALLEESQSSSETISRDKMHWYPATLDDRNLKKDAAHTQCTSQSECQQPLVVQQQYAEQNVSPVPQRTIILPNGMPKMFPILHQADAEYQHPSQYVQPPPQHVQQPPQQTVMLSDGVQQTFPAMHQVWNQPQPHFQFDNVGMSASIVAVPVDQFAAPYTNQIFFNQLPPSKLIQHNLAHHSAPQYQNLQSPFHEHMNQRFMREFQSQQALPMPHYHQPVNIALPNGQSGLHSLQTRLPTPLIKQKTTSRKNKRIRTAFTTHQILCLEQFHSQKDYVSKQDRELLSLQLNIPEKSIKVWFQNRRMKVKRDMQEIQEELEQEEQELKKDIQNTPNDYSGSIIIDLQNNSYSSVSDMDHLEAVANSPDEAGYVTLDEKAMTTLFNWINHQCPELLNSWQEPDLNCNQSDIDSKEQNMKASCSKLEQKSKAEPLHETISSANLPSTSTTTSASANIENVKIFNSDDISEYEGKNDEWSSPKNKQELDQLFDRLFC